MLPNKKDAFYLNGSAGRVGIGGVTGLAGALEVGAPQHSSSGLEHLATILTLMLTLPLVLYVVASPEHCFFGLHAYPWLANSLQGRTITGVGDCVKLGSLQHVSLPLGHLRLSPSLLPMTFSCLWVNLGDNLSEIIWPLSHRLSWTQRYPWFS